MFRKSQWLDTSHRSLLNAVISQDTETREFVRLMFQEKQKRLLYDFFEEGKSLEYFNPGLSTETILIYLDGIRGIAYTNPEFFSMIEKDRNILREFVRIIFFGLMGKDELPEGFNDI